MDSPHPRAELKAVAASASAVVELPLRGEWSVERTPADRIPSHGTDLLGQRYAYDLLRTDHRPGFHLHPAGTLRWLLIGGADAGLLRLGTSGPCGLRRRDRRGRGRRG